jgi:rubrerythrin
LFYDDRNTITAKQKQHLATRFHKKYSIEEIKAYQTDHAKLSNRVIWLDNLGLSLRIPTLSEYEVAGMEWIEQVIDSTQGVFNEREYGQNRAAWIDMQSTLTSARQYAHWVDELFFREEDGEEASIGADKERINSFLDHVCSDSRYIGDFLEKVTKFMDDATLAVIAISTYVCPKCGHTEKGTHPRFQNLVQLDALTTFFTLIRRKM